MIAMAHLQKNIERIEAYRRANKLTKRQLAEMAGLHFNSLRSLGRQDWNPTLETLMKLEAVVPSDFEVAA